MDFRLWIGATFSLAPSPCSRFSPLPTPSCQSAAPRASKVNQQPSPLGRRCRTPAPPSAAARRVGVTCRIRHRQLNFGALGRPLWQGKTIAEAKVWSRNLACEGVIPLARAELRYNPAPTWERTSNCANALQANSGSSPGMKRKSKPNFADRHLTWATLPSGGMKLTLRGRT